MRPLPVTPLVVFALAVLLATLETQRGKRDAAWRGEARTSILLGLFAVLLKALVAPHGAALEFSGETVVLFAVVFLLDDFLYYAAHRTAHRVNVFWASHAVHHSSTRYNFFMGLRQPPTWLFTPAAAAPLLLILLGFPVALVALSGGIRALHHFLLHTERVGRLRGAIEFIFNTPSHHRVHHSSEPRFLDKNYGGVLIVWDRLFGTFAPEPAEGIARYGVVGMDFDPSVRRVVMRPWKRLARRVRTAPTWRAKAAALVAAPNA